MNWALITTVDGICHIPRNVAKLDCRLAAGKIKPSLEIVSTKLTDKKIAAYLTLDMWNCGFLLLATCIVQTVHTATHDNAKTLLQDLLAGYNTELRPVQDQDRPVYVATSLTLGGLIDFNEKAAVITTVGFVIVAWTDEILMWDPRDHGNVTSLTCTQGTIWHPNLFTFDPQQNPAPLGNVGIKMTIAANGQVRWVVGCLIRGVCAPDMSKFPFDQQTCSIEMFSSGFTSAQLSFVMPLPSIDMTNFRRNNEWNVLDTSTFVTTSSVFDVATFRITIQRKPTNVLVTVIIPIIILGLVNPLVFVLPFSSGERSSYSITMLLSFTVYMTVVSDSLPESSEPMSYLAYYILATLSTSAIIVAVNIWQIRLYDKKRDSSVPHWIRKCFIHQHNLNRHRKVDVIEYSTTKELAQDNPRIKLESTNRDDTECVISVQPSETSEVVRNNNVMTDTARSRNISWSMVAKRLDTIYFVGFEFLISVCTLVLLSVTAT